MAGALARGAHPAEGILLLWDGGHIAVGSFGKGYVCFVPKDTDCCIKAPPALHPFIVFSAHCRWGPDHFILAWIDTKVSIF